MAFCADHVPFCLGKVLPNMMPVEKQTLFKARQNKSPWRWTRMTNIDILQLFSVSQCFIWVELLHINRHMLCYLYILQANNLNLSQGQIRYEAWCAETTVKCDDSFHLTLKHVLFNTLRLWRGFPWMKYFSQKGV